MPVKSAPAGDAAFSMGLLRGERICRWVTGAECWLMRRFDVVSTISRRMHELLLRKGVPALRAKLAVNWVNMASFALPSAAGVAAYRQVMVVSLFAGGAQVLVVGWLIKINCALPMDRTAKAYFVLIKRQK